VGNASTPRKSHERRKNGVDPRASDSGPISGSEAPNDESGKGQCPFNGQGCYHNMIVFFANFEFENESWPKSDKVMLMVL
jgi:hypothetical protein